MEVFEGELDALRTTVDRYWDINLAPIVGLCLAHQNDTFIIFVVDKLAALQRMIQIVRSWERAFRGATDALPGEFYAGAVAIIVCHGYGFHPLDIRIGQGELPWGTCTGGLAAKAIFSRFIVLKHRFGKAFGYDAMVSPQPRQRVAI